MPQYANISTSSQGNKPGGFKPVIYFNKISEITTFQYPTAAGSVLGDSTKIATAHTWVTATGAWSWEAKLGSVLLTKETQGDEGAKVDIWTCKVKVLGLDAATIEQMKNALNDQKVIWIKDANCLVSNFFYQMGDECNPVTVNTTFDGKDNLPTSAGQKEWEITFQCQKLYTYEAALDTTF